MKLALKYYVKYIPFMLIVVASLFGQAMCELALPGYLADIVNKGIVGEDSAQIYHYGGIMLLVTLGSVACAVVGSFFSARVGAFSSRDLTGSIFNKVSSFSDAEMDKFSTASLITRSTNDIQMMQQASIMLLRMAIFSPLMGIGALIRALNTSRDLTWTIGLALAVVLLLIIVLFFIVMPKFRIMQSKLDRLNLVVAERMSGLLVVRAFNAEAKEEKRFDDANVDVTKLNIFVNRAMAFMFPTMTIIMNAVGITIVWVGSHMMEAGNLLVGDMLAFLEYSMHVIMSFLMISMIFIMIPRAAVSAQRVGAVLGTEVSIKDPENPEEITDKRGLVEFRNVSFAYSDTADNALTDISFTAEPGKTTAIIGGTGSGKTTLINLIPRLFDRTEGEVLVDGHDVRNLRQSDLRAQVGFVPQKGLLFSGSVAENLRYGKEDATEEEMREAEIAQAAKFIDEMPEKYDTHIAQGGTSISGGQKQRLSIARALIKDPSIYIFDDSFSALDFTTDAALRRALKEKVGDKTFIIVAQRINTIMDAGQIIVLDDGKIMGKGTHSELLSTCDVYKEIATSQLSEEELRKEGA